MKTKNYLTIATIVTAGLLAVTEAWASDTVYRYKDKNGVIHLTNIQSDHRYVPVFGAKQERNFSGTKRHRYINKVIEMASAKHSVDPALVRAVIKAESDFNPYAVSYAGAKGLMQLMPETAESLDVINPFDIEENIFGGVKHLKSLIRHFEGDLKLSVAAYNAGQNAVKRYGGIPPYKQTKKYVERVMAFYSNYKKTVRSN